MQIYIKIDTFLKVTKFLKHNSAGYEPTKAKVSSR